MNYIQSSMNIDTGDLLELINYDKNMTSFYGSFRQIYDPLFGPKGKYPRETDVINYKYKTHPEIHAFHMENKQYILQRIGELTAITIFCQVEGDVAYGGKIIGVKSTHSDMNQRKLVENDLHLTSYYSEPCNKYKNGIRLLPRYIVIHKLHSNQRIDVIRCHEDFVKDMNRNKLLDIIQKNTIILK